MLKLYTFGETRVYYKDKLLDIPTKVLGFLIYLIFRPEGASREFLSNFFWPAYNYNRAKRILSQRLHLLGKIIPDFKRYLVYEKDLIKFKFFEDYYVDFLEFIDLMEKFRKSKSQDKEKSALRLKEIYKKEFLINFGVKGSEEFDEWLFIKRESFQSSFLEILDFLLNYYRDRKEYEKASVIACEYLKIDCICEGVNASLIELYYLLNKRELAMRHYRKFKDILHKQTGLEPSPETINIYNKVFSKEKIQKTKVFPKNILIDYYEETKPLKLIGRDEILNNLKKLTKPATFLTGESGMGKTRILHEFIKNNQAASYLIYCRCKKNSSSVPYEALVEGLEVFLKSFNYELDLERYYINELAQFLPKLREKYGLSVSESVSKEMIFESFLALFRNFAEDFPLVLILDDLQHADNSTPELLDYIIPKFDNNNIFMLAGYTVPEVKYPKLENLLDSLKEKGLSEYLPLDRISKNDFLKFIHDRKFIDILYEESEGIPLYFSENIQGLISEGKAEYKPGGEIELSVPVKNIPTSASFKSVVLNMFRNLSDKAQKFAKFLSTLAEEVSDDMLKKIYGAREEELAGALNELLENKILKRKESANKVNYAFFHAKIKDIIYDSILKADRVAIHRRNAHLLENAYKNAPDYYGFIAHQFLKCNEIKKASDYYFKAGRNALEAGLNRSALESFKMADNLVESLSVDEKFILKKHLARLYYIVEEDFSASLDYYNRALELTKDPLERAVISVDRRYVETFLGKIDDTSSFEDLKEAFKKVDLKKYSAHSVDYMRANLVKIHILIKEKNLTKAEETALKLLKDFKVCRRREDKILKLEIYKYLFIIYNQNLKYEKARNYHRKAIKLARGLKLFRTVAYFLNISSYPYFLRDDFIKSIQCLKESMFVAEKTGIFSIAANSAYNIGDMCFRVGDIEKQENYLKLAESFIQPQDKHNKIIGNYFRGMYYLSQKNVKELEKTIENYALAIKDSGLKTHEGYMWWLKGMLLNLKGAPYRDIEPYFIKVIDFYKKNGMFIEEAWVKYEFALINREKSTNKAYIAYLKEARDAFSKINNTRKINAINKILAEN